jgi:cell division septal protein FtsQ
MFQKKGPARGESPKAQLLRKKKQDLKKRKALFYGTVLVVFLGLIIGFFWLPFLRIKQITISPLLTIEEDEVKNFVDARISRNVLLVLPGENIFLINKKSLVKALKNEYSAIDTVEVNKDFTGLHFVVTERSPKTIWCQNQEGNSPCYFIHEDGTIFEVAGEFSNPLFFVFYTPLEKQDDPIGSLVLPVEEFKRVTDIQKLLATYGIRLYGYKKNTDGYESFLLTPIILDGSPSAYIKSQQIQSSETVVSKIVTSLKNAKLKESKEGRFATLDYIDIRFNDQVSFKFK